MDVLENSFRWHLFHTVQISGQAVYEFYLPSLNVFICLAAGQWMCQTLNKIISTFKVPTTKAVIDHIIIIIIFFFQRKFRLDSSCESSYTDNSHEMSSHFFFLEKKKEDILECHL